MKKLIFIIVVISIIGNLDNTLFAQEAKSDSVKNWKSSGVFSLNAAQSSFTNWAAGGQNTVGLSGLINYTANYKKDKNAWDNSFDFGYGILQQGKNKSWLKTDDKINITSKYGYLASKSWYYSVLFNLRSQFAPGYNYPNDSVKISSFFAPAYVIFAIGMDYKPNDNISLFMTPLTLRSTIVADKTLSDIGAFGVDPGKKLKNEFGAYINFQYKKDEIVKNINFLTKIDIFSNYLKDPQNVDVNWETLFVLKVNKFVSATIATNLVYDDNTKIGFDTNHDGVVDKYGARTQFKEVIGVGFTYKFAR
jgi:hypothetical protein